MKAIRYVEASTLIDGLVETLQYSRAHIAKVLRANSSLLNAKKLEGRWLIPSESAPRLRELVLRHSGPRYKLGETGPNAA